MRKSSAAQLEFDLSGQASVDSVPAADNESTFERPGPSSTQRFPSFNLLSGELHAIAARQAGRLNASSISEQEIDELHKQRQALLDKKFNRTMTRQDEIKLEYIRWSLDRIEDAKHGSALDTLESSVAMYERFLAEVADLKKQLWARKQGRRR
jgi:hypothetical protein